MTMKEIELDVWFYNLPAGWQEEISGIKLSDYWVTDENDGTYEDDDPYYDYYYEFFDNAVSYWWDCLDYDEKLAIYNRENR